MPPPDLHTPPSISPQLWEQEERLFDTLVSEVGRRSDISGDLELSALGDPLLATVVERLCGLLERMMAESYLYASRLGDVELQLARLNALCVDHAWDVAVQQQLGRRLRDALQKLVFALRLYVRRHAPAAPSAPAGQRQRIAQAIRAALGDHPEGQKVRWVGIYFAWRELLLQPFPKTYSDFVLNIAREYGNESWARLKDTYKEYGHDTYMSDHPVSQWKSDEWAASLPKDGVRAKTKYDHFPLIHAAAQTFMQQMQP